MIKHLEFILLVTFTELVEESDQIITSFCVITEANVFIRSMRTTLRVMNTNHYYWQIKCFSKWLNRSASCCIRDKLCHRTIYNPSSFECLLDERVVHWCQPSIFRDIKEYFYIIINKIGRSLV